MKIDINEKKYNVDKTQVESGHSAIWNQYY